MDLSNKSTIEEIDTEDSETNTTSSIVHFIDLEILQKRIRKLKRWKDEEKEKLISLVSCNQIDLNVTGGLKKGDKNKHKEKKNENKEIILDCLGCCSNST